MIFFRNRHFFHIVTPSPWPVCGSLGLFGLAIGGVLGFNFFIRSKYVLFWSFFFLIYTLTLWWRDVIREGTFEGCHTFQVKLGLSMGMIFFIVSEVMFFFSFFWAFFHSSLAPTIEIGSVWPPEGLHVFKAWDIPLLNTVILLLSGATITWAHFAIILSNRVQTLLAVVITICLALFFTTLQLCEYLEADFNISDGIYGSIFFMSTGFHGFHVIIGSIFIIICFFRVIVYHFSSTHHLGFESASWYWHFVDVVWLFLYSAVYCWGNMDSSNCSDIIVLCDGLITNSPYIHFAYFNV